MLLSSTAAALPANTVVIGNKAYSIDALFNGKAEGIQEALNAAQGKLYFNLPGQTTGFVGLFNKQDMTDAQKNELSNILFTDATGKKSIYKNFNDAIGEEVEGEITVVSATAVNGTTIEVKFSDNVTKQFTVSPLTGGTNQRTVTYLGVNYPVTVNYTPPTAGAAVKNIEFVDYRNIKVTFNTVVDQASATNPSNYYMEIIDGDAQYGLLALPPTLQDSNQFSKIETTYPGGIAKWWQDGHIVATTVNGETVVSINLPEDARFTNVVDTELGNYPAESEDAERTLAVELQTSKPGPTTYKLLTKDVSVNVAVRNVKDAAGKFSINTATMPIRILDTVKPKLLAVNKVTANGTQTVVSGNLGSNVGNFDLFRSGKQFGESLQFVYSEPVFDTHDLDKSDLEGFRNIQLYVNGKPVASREQGNLDQFMTFEMGADATYAGAKIVSLDAEAAVKAVYKEYFATGINYEIRFVGVTDLAGNIEVSSEHTFNVKFKDDRAVPPVIVQPKVIETVQVADNVFRVEFNRAGVEGTLAIENPDGEGRGVLEMPIPPSTLSPDGKYYSYVAVPAKDHEPADAIPTGVFQNQVLAYDGQDTIIRTVRVNDVVVNNDAVSSLPLHGDDHIQNNMRLVDDIKAPKVFDSEAIAYATRGSSISFNVKDIVPWIEDKNLHHWVSPIAYTYNAAEMRFENTIVANQDGADTYLPIKVSYIDGNGAKHQAVVSNYNLRPYWFWGTEFTDVNPGSPGNITFDFSLDRINLDLSDYPQLLDKDGKLVAGAKYTAEFESGYFTDAPQDTNFTQYWGDNELDVPNYAYDFTFGGYSYDILNVDDGRDDTNYFWWFPIDAGLGFTSTKQVVNVDVNQKPGDPDPVQYVPQTSKQLINYDEPTKSLKIEFTGTIDVNTLKNRANYSINGKTLEQWDAELGTNTVIDYVVNNSNPDNVRQYAVFIVPQDSIPHDGDYEFVVSGVAHPNGGMMTPVATVVGLRDNTRPVATEAVITGDRQIKLTFNEAIRYHVDPALFADPISTARNFRVTIGGVNYTVLTAVLPAGGDNDREIILNLGNDIPANGDITVEIVEDQNHNILVIDKSENKNPMKKAIYNVTRP